MKLYYIVNARIPTEKAHGYQIMKMCEAFAAQGADAELWVPTRQNPIKEDAFAYYQIKPSFQISHIRSLDFLRFVRFLGALSFFAQSAAYLFRLALMKPSKDSLVITRNPEIAWLFSRRGYPTVYECHDWFGRRKQLALALLKSVPHIITTNRYIRKEFIEHGFDSRKILVAPNGIELDTFGSDIGKEAAIARLSLPDLVKDAMRESRILLYTGSYTTMGVEKGIDEILVALKKIGYKDMLFFAVGGSGKDIEHYRKQAVEKGVSDSSFFVGRVSQHELSLYQRASDILLMPFPRKAHYEYHMTPLKMFEYMASGRPIIASDLPSIREILSDDTCLFCKPGDADDLALKISVLAEEAEYAVRIAARARQRVKQFAWSKRAGKILKFLEENG